MQKKLHDFNIGDKVRWCDRLPDYAHMGVGEVVWLDHEWIKVRWPGKTKPQLLVPDEELLIKVRTARFDSSDNSVALDQEFAPVEQHPIFDKLFREIGLYLEFIEIAS